MLYIQFYGCKFFIFIKIHKKYSVFYLLTKYATHKADCNTLYILCNVWVGILC